MHTFKGRSGTTFHFNGGGDGQVVIPLKKQGGEVYVPCEDLVDFVAELVRRKRQSQLDDMSAEELFGLKVEEE